MGKPVYWRLFAFFLIVGSNAELLSQQMESNFLVSLDGIYSSESTNPFWFSHNNHFKIGAETSVVGLASWRGVYQLNENSGFDAGVSGYYRNGVATEFQRKELFLNYKNRWLKATLGAEERIDPSGGLSATGKNFLWSPNARALPGLLLEASQPFKIATGFNVDWGIAHYELNDNRYVSNTYVHYKRLGLNWQINAKNSLTGRIQHFAQWAGTSPEYGKLDSDFEAFIDVFFASQPEDSIIDGEAVNALGNHLGSYFLEYQYMSSIGRFSFYHEHPFEDGSGTALANFPDGVWGLSLEMNGFSFFKNIYFEYIDTTDQSGNTSRSGFDGYFGNSVYRSGWTYDGNIIGVPLLGIDPTIEITPTSSPFVSNRIRAFHLGVDGAYKNIQWQFKSTINHSLGTYQRPFPETLKNWYNYASLNYQTEIYGRFQLYLGLDTGSEINTVFGAGLNYSYTF